MGPQSTMYTTVTIPEQTTICPVPVQTPAEPTHKVPEVHESTTMVPEVPVPTTHEVPYVPVPTKEISQPPPVHETPYVPSPPPPPGDAFYCGQHPRHPRRALGPCSSASRSPGQHPRRASPRLDASLRQQRH